MRFGHREAVQLRYLFPESSGSEDSQKFRDLA